MPRFLSASSSLDVLRGDAKRWLRALAAGDLEALQRFRVVFPNHTGDPKLRQVQHALAREHGFSSWAALKQEIEDRARSFADRVRLFLEKSVNRYSTDPATQRARILARGTMTNEALDAILARQLPDAEKRKRANFVVDTSHGLDPVRAAIRDILAEVVKMPQRRA